ncbi:MAG: cadherin-like beta sandwich domain-containing protein [Saccharofermentanales bacterium]
MNKRKVKLMKSIALACMLFLFGPLTAVPAIAEGSSANVFLSLSRPVLNIGKNFTLSLKVEPNAKLPITSFDATIRFDTTKFDLVKDGSVIKITKPSAVPSAFRLDATVTGGDITILGTDESVAQNSPINATVATSLITLTFRVKDSAVLGNTAFTISDCTINKLESGSPVSVPLTIISPKTATVAARLDTNAYLSEITVGTGTLTPAFSKTTTKYTVEVPTEVSTITVSSKKESANAKMTMSGDSTLDYGTNKFVITVTAQDPDVIRYYTITVTRQSPPLSPTEIIPSPTEAITPSPTLSPEPTEIISAASSSSSSAASIPDATTVAKEFWQLMAYIFFALFMITLIILVSVLVNKKHSDESELKIKRR